MHFRPGRVHFSFFLSLLVACAPVPDVGGDMWQVIDRPEFQERVFFPRASHSAPPAFADDHRIEVATGVSLGARLHFFDPAFRTVLAFHGNGETVPDYDDIAPAFRSIGLNLFVVDYRGYGWSDGSPGFRTYHEDSKAVSAYFLGLIADRQPAAPRPLVFGRSLGSHPATLIATDNPAAYAGLILESGFADIVPLLSLLGVDPGPHAEELRRIFSNDRRLSGTNIPVLILHGELDQLIPASHARDNHRAASNSTLALLPGVGHNDVLRQADLYFKSIRQFVQTLPQ